jgi:hypothetical protein
MDITVPMQIDTPLTIRELRSIYADTENKLNKLLEHNNNSEVTNYLFETAVFYLEIMYHSNKCNKNEVIFKLQSIKEKYYRSKATTSLLTPNAVHTQP